jgi:hypothetical protein
MTQAFVLGNGISRKTVAPEHLRLHGPVYGCNALYREFAPDVLVATDRPIAAAIQESGYANQHVFHTRRPLPGLGARPVPAAYFGHSSGPIATALAAQAGHTAIYLVGFDMGPAQNQQFNNVYAGTEFYKMPTALPTFTGNWIKQLIRIAQDFPLTQFVRVHGATTANIEQFATVPNFKSIDLSEFCNQFAGVPQTQTVVNS